MKLDDAERLAAEIAGWLRPAARAVVPVGSIRRRRPDVHDVELAVLPARQLDLFGGGAPALHLIDAVVDHHLAEHRWVGHPRHPAYGPRLKRLWVPSLAVQVELWIADGDGNWGNVLAIRTGDASFSRALVTGRARGGLMPEGMRQDDGYLWRGAERLDCPDESAFFTALGIGEVPDPAARDGALARRLAGQVLHGN